MEENAFQMYGEMICSTLTHAIASNKKYGYMPQILLQKDVTTMVGKEDAL